MKDRYEISTILTGQTRDVEQSLDRVTRKMRAYERQIRMTQSTFRREHRITQFATGRPAGGAFASQGGGIGYAGGRGGGGSPNRAGSAGTLLVGGVSRAIISAYAGYRIIESIINMSKDAVKTTKKWEGIADIFGKGFGYGKALRKFSEGVAGKYHLPIDKIREFASIFAEANNNLSEFKERLAIAAQASRAYNIDMTTLGRLTAELKGTPEQVAAQIHQLYVSTKEGKIGIGSLGTIIPQLQGQMSLFGRKNAGITGTTDLAAMLQMARGVTGSPEEAKTAVSRFLTKIMNPEVLKALGVSMKDQSGEIRRVRDILYDILKVVEKNPDILPKLQSKFGEQAVRVIYGARAAGPIKFSNLTKVLGNAAQLQADTTKRMNSVAGKMESSINKLENQMTEMKEKYSTKGLELLVNVSKRPGETLVAAGIGALIGGMLGGPLGAKLGAAFVAYISTSYGAKNSKEVLTKLGYDKNKGFHLWRWLGLQDIPITGKEDTLINRAYRKSRGSIHGKFIKNLIGSIPRLSGTLGEISPEGGKAYRLLRETFLKYPTQIGTKETQERLNRLQSYIESYKGQLPREVLDKLTEAFNTFKALQDFMSKLANRPQEMIKVLVQVYDREGNEKPVKVNVKKETEPSMSSEEYHKRLRKLTGVY